MVLTCSSARVALTGAGPGAIRLSSVEEKLNGQVLSASLIENAVKDAVQADELLSDPFASSEYRAHLVSVMAKKALSRANPSSVTR